MQNAASGALRFCVYCTCSNCEDYLRVIIISLVGKNAANTIWGWIQFKSEIYSRKYSNNFLSWRWTLLARWMSAFCARHERFSPGDECVENARSNFSPTLPLPHSYLLVTFKQNLPWDDCYSHVHVLTSEMDGSYHALIVTSKYATPISYICNSILCWNKWPSSRLSW